jgi:folate-binding protein YgfZ
MHATTDDTLAASAAATLTRAAVCELTPFGLLAFDGADAETFLQGQLSNDVRDVSRSRWQFTSYNSPKGRMLATLRLWAEDGGYRAIVPRDILEPLRKRLAMYVLRSKVTVRDASAERALLGVAGPGGAELVGELASEVPEPLSVVANYTASVLGIAPDRFIVVASPDDALSLRERWRGVADLAAPELWRWLEVRAGVPIIAGPTQDLFVAQTANLDAIEGLSFDKGCYTGQEIIARTRYLGRIKERMFVFHAAPGVDVAPGLRLFSTVFGEQACGTVIDAARAPHGGTDLLAVVQIAAADAGSVRLGAQDGPVLDRLPLPYPLPEPATPVRRP